MYDIGEFFIELDPVGANSRCVQMRTPQSECSADAAEAEQYRIDRFLVAAHMPGRNFERSSPAPGWWRNFYECNRVNWCGSDGRRAANGIWDGSRAARNGSIKDWQRWALGSRERNNIRCDMEVVKTLLIKLLIAFVGDWKSLELIENGDKIRGLIGVQSMNVFPRQERQ